MAAFLKMEMALDLGKESEAAVKRVKIEIRPLGRLQTKGEGFSS